MDLDSAVFMNPCSVEYAKMQIEKVEHRRKEMFMLNTTLRTMMSRTEEPGYCMVISWAKCVSENREKECCCELNKNYSVLFYRVFLA